jgi:capsular polysaccharide biosynthesis protein
MMNDYIRAVNVVSLVWLVALLYTLGLLGVAIKLIAIYIAVCTVATLCVAAAVTAKHVWDRYYKHTDIIVDGKVVRTMYTKVS